MDTMDPFAMHRDPHQATGYAARNGNETQHPVLAISGRTSFGSAGQLPPTPITPSMQVECDVNQLKDEVQQAELKTSVLTAQIEQHKQLITNLARSNAEMHTFMGLLSDKIERIEAENAALREEVAENRDEIRRGRGMYAFQTQTPTGSPRRRANHNQPRTVEDRLVDLDNYPQSPSEAVGRLKLTDTPQASIRSVPWTPHRPKRTSKPESSQLKTERQPFNMLNKRKAHNLTAMLPPPYTQIPQVPLTDTEIVVYFFQSLSRPAVSLRLYSRGWGPAKIVEVLNDHRDIDPPYLRNTCSVKCVKAQRLGVEKFGIDWEERLRETFKTCDDVEATKLIMVAPEETEEIQNVDLQELTKSLRTHPELYERPGEYGIFTRCVMWAEETGQSWRMSDVHILAQHLEAGTTPEPPTYPPDPDAAVGESQSTRESGENTPAELDFEDPFGDHSEDDNKDTIGSQNSSQRKSNSASQTEDQSLSDSENQNMNLGHGHGDAMDLGTPEPESEKF